MLKNGVEKHASDIIEYPFFIRYLSAKIIGFTIMHIIRCFLVSI